MDGRGESRSVGGRARGAGNVARDAIARFRRADGTSHSRSLAYHSMFIILSGFVGLVGLASLLAMPSLRAIVQELARTLAPGPSGRLLREAAKQGASGGATATIVGFLAALSAGTLAMAQIQRSADRLSGEPEDRPTMRRYGLAFVMALSSGIVLAAGALVLAGGSAIATGAGWKHAASSVWAVSRWPLGIALVGVGVYVLFRVAPQRPLGSSRDVAIGAVVAIVLWVLFTVVLSAYYAIAGGSSAYGPLMSIIALLVWASLTAFALHAGLATAAELGARVGEREAVRLPGARPAVATSHGG